jgi:hypothetical protein
MLDWAHNHLLVKAGFELDHNTDATSLLRNQRARILLQRRQLHLRRAGLSEIRSRRRPRSAQPAQLRATSNTTFGSQALLLLLFADHGPYATGILSTNDWAGYATAQWQAAKLAVFSVRPALGA